MKTKVASEINVSVSFKPGEWVISGFSGMWSISNIEFTIFRTPSGEWITHVALSNFRGWKRNDRNTAWSQDRKPQYPGFWPRMEIVPQNVLDALKTAYEAEGVTPAELPPAEAGKGTPR